MTSSGFSSNCPENQINTATAEGGQFSKKTKANRAQKWDASTCLAFAVRARTNQSRERWAQRGLEDSSESDLEVRVLLLRQLYLVRIEEEQINEALKIVDQMAQIGALRDLVEHDRARLLWAVGQKQEAIRAQRYALRLAPPDRRSFHGMALAAFLFFCGDLDSALRAAVKAERWSHRDRALVRAFRALIELSLNRTPEEIEEIQRALFKSRLREGYGRYVLGMIAYRLGNRARAVKHLRAFLHRNSKISRAKEITLKEELECARSILSEVEGVS